MKRILVIAVMALATFGTAVASDFTEEKTDQSVVQVTVETSTTAPVVPVVPVPTDPSTKQKASPN